MAREELIARLARRPPGRRGFGGTDDPVEAAEVRAATRGDHDLNPGETAPSAALRPAAVLVPLIDRAEGMTVLLTRRTAHLSAHAGQIAFPGGRIEREDADAVAAALRETEEEVGLPRELVSIVGRLDTYVTGTGFEITPIVGIVAPLYTLTIDPHEVAEAFEVPLAYILDKNNHNRTERESAGRTRVFFVLPYEGRNIWGATAGMLVNLAEVLAPEGLEGGMLRELLTLVVPLLLPTVLYLVWLRAVRWPEEAGGAVPWRAMPWVWLAVIGVALTALVLFVVTVHFGTSTPGVYAPPHLENGRIVPGRIVPEKP